MKKSNQKELNEFCQRYGFENGQSVFSDSLYLGGCTLPDNLVLPTTIGDYLDLTGCTLPDNLVLPTTIGGSLYLTGCTLPDNLVLPTTIGGSLYLTGCTLPDKVTAQLPILQHQNIPFMKWGKGNGDFVLADGKFSEVISKKGNVWRLKDVGKKNEYFLVTDGNGKYAHGDTIKEAKADLIYKNSERNKDDFKGMDVNEKLPYAKCIEVYRVITGACQQGVKSFIESAEIKPQKFTILEMAKKTKGQYGNAEFCNFFKI
jgi:hypothetical protein